MNKDGMIDMANPDEIPAIHGKTGRNTENCMFSSDGRSIIARSSVDASGNKASDLLIWTLSDGQFSNDAERFGLGDLDDYQASNSKGVDISPDGTQVYAIGAKKLVFWDRDYDTKTKRWMLENKQEITVDELICDVKVTPGKYCCKHVFVALLHSIVCLLITVF